MKNKFSLWSFEVFVTIAEERSISSAAKRLKSSNASISQQLTNLEKTLGCRLMDRNTRPMCLLPTGRIFLHRARAVLSEVMQARAELAQFDQSQILRLRLGMIGDFDADVTPNLMNALSAKMCNCSFLLETGASYDLVDELYARTIDIVVCADLEQAPDWMDVYPILKEPFVIAAPKGVIDQSHNIKEQLFSQHFIRFSSRTVMGRQIETHLIRQRVQLPNKFEFNNYHAILGMVADGIGWTITTPMGYFRARRFMGEIDLFPLPFIPMSRQISLIARKDTFLDMPGNISNTLRPIIQKQLINRITYAYPWLKETFYIIK